MTETTNTHETANGVYGVLTAGICKPILFSTPMIQAILKGDKTQTRRKIKHKSKIEEVRPVMKCVENEKDWGKYILTDEFGEDFLIKPKYNVGDFIWVRETWQHTKELNLHPTDENYGYVYKADGQPWEDYEGWNWKPSIFMPKNACRIYLKVKNVRVERLDDITKENAINEGIEKWQQQGCTRYRSYVKPMVGFWDTYNSTGGVHPSIASFRSLWASINGFDNLNSNPWVFVYDFERTDALSCR